MDFNGLFGPIMVDLGGTEYFRQNNHFGLYWIVNIG